MFKILRFDSDIVVISNKYADELRSLPREILSSTAAIAEVRGLTLRCSSTHLRLIEIAQDLVGSYTNTNIILDTDLHLRVAQTHLSHNLVNILPMVQDELDFAMKTEFPACEGESGCGFDLGIRII